jgi:C4-dicarboxylate transporter DctQ subunit
VAVSRPSPIGAALDRADRVLCAAENGFIGVALAFASGLLFVNVVLRYIFRDPIPWAEEISIYLIVWIVFVGGSVAVRTRGHIAIDLLPLMLSPANRRRLAIGVAVVMAAFFAVFFYYSGAHTLRIRAGGQVMPVLQAPMWLTYLAMPVGSFLMGLRTVQLLARLVIRPVEDQHRMDLQD